MLAYVLAGGTFLFYLLHTWIPVSAVTFSVCWGVVCMGLLLGGNGVVRAVHRYVLPAFFLLLAILSIFSFSRIDPAHFSPIHVDAWVLPLGVLLFSLSALPAIPEMREAVKNNRMRLHRALVVGMVVVGIVYALFSALVVGIAGVHTPEQAIAAFARVAPWMVFAGSLLGLVTVTIAYINIGSALVHTLVYDMHIRILSAVIFVGSVPLAAVLLGVTSMVHVVQYAGGVLGALLAIFVLIAYEKARSSGRIARQYLVSPVVSFLLFVFFFVMAVMTLRGL